MLEIFIGLLIFVSFGIISMKLADAKGLNKIMGFVLGFLLGIFGIAIILLLKKKN